MEIKKVVSAVAINALSEALTNIYWYKPDLQNFLTNALSEPIILSKLNWSDAKRNIASTLVQLLACNQEIHKNELLVLMKAVCKMDDFSHLERLDDGRIKSKKAKESVEALKKQMQDHLYLIEDQIKHEEIRKANHEKILKIQGTQQKREEIKKEYFKLFNSIDPQGRGFSFEKVMRDLFELFDLDPKASFKIQGEQIDGAFTFENTDFLFEGKWQQDKCGIQDLDAFCGKITRKLDNTLGLFCSINGYSESAVTQHSNGRRFMILMDGSDLMAVLEGRISLPDLLLRKRRHASQTGNIYFKIQEILIS